MNAGAVLAVVIAPPLVVQLAREAASWVPGTLSNVVSGVTAEVGVRAARLALAAWAVVPAAIGLAAPETRRRMPQRFPQ